TSCLCPAKNLHRADVEKERASGRADRCYQDEITERRRCNRGRPNVPDHEGEQTRREYQMLPFGDALSLPRHPPPPISTVYRTPGGGAMVSRIAARSMWRDAKVERDSRPMRHGCSDPTRGGFL